VTDVPESSTVFPGLGSKTIIHMRSNEGRLLKNVQMQGARHPEE
jgi:hypothetical protein